MNDRIRIGDHVRVNRQTGRVVDVIRQPSRYNTDPRGEYRVRLDNGAPTIYTRDAVKIEEPADPPIELPMKNLQAATFAHQLLGPSADLDKLIGVAEFAMDRRTLGTQTTGTVGTGPTVGTLTIDVVPDVTAVEKALHDLRTAGGRVTEPPAVEASEETLKITDRDGDRLTLDHMGYGTTLAKVWVGKSDYVSGQAVYLTEADVDAVIARLQAFKAQGFTVPF